MSEPSSEAYPKILRTGSMLELSAKLVEGVPPQLGPYTILERIGEGGMGIVYLAEQAPPLARRVAIKLARSTVSDGRALARFESERQTLAVMNHPGIARIFDSGNVPDGRPYFVMEHVGGVSITDFCDAGRLDVEARLELFLRVCDAVQHAHVNAIIHRDLKPSNILVANGSRPATPKIIDFGVAKALGVGGATEKGHTQFGQIVGTPEYMSPEQAALDGRPVDTRTDVYALGVVLYELLVGSRPFERGTGPDVNLLDLCRRIREDESERPSVRALRAPETAAQARALAPRLLARRVRGDLDSIAMKALAKTPEGRYPSPAELAADIERHLSHRPVDARSPGLFHRFGRFVRRRRAATGIVAALSVTLVGLAVLGTDQLLRAQKEQARADAQTLAGAHISDFLLEVLNPPATSTAQADRLLRFQSPIRDVLEQIHDGFADRPVLESQLVMAAGHLNLFVGSDRELETLQKARDQIVSLVGPDEKVTFTIDEAVAESCVDLGRYPEAERLLTDVLERRTRIAGPEHPDTLRTTSKLAIVYKAWAKHERATELFEVAIAGLMRCCGADDLDVLGSKMSLSGSYLELGRYEETRILLEDALDAIRRGLGARGLQAQVSLYNLACAHANLGRIEPAMSYLRDAVEAGFAYPGGPARDPLLLPLHGDPRFWVLERKGHLNTEYPWGPALYDAKARIRAGRPVEAERELREVVAAIERVDRKPGDDRGMPFKWALAKSLILQRRFEEAEGLLEPTLRAARGETVGEDAPLRDHLETLELLVECDIGRGRRDAALARIAAIVAISHPRFKNVERLYAEAQAEAIQGRDQAALKLLAQSSELGFADPERIEHDLAFVTLRARPEFQAILRTAREHELLR